MRSGHRRRNIDWNDVEVVRARTSRSFLFLHCCSRSHRISPGAIAWPVCREQASALARPVGVRRCHWPGIVCSNDRQPDPDPPPGTGSRYAGAWQPCWSGPGSLNAARQPPKRVSTDSDPRARTAQEALPVIRLAAGRRNAATVWPMSAKDSLLPSATGSIPFPYASTGMCSRV